MSADSPITLEEACRLYPGARYKVATLRAAASRGELVIFHLGRRLHTTPADMADWVARCRAAALESDARDFRRKATRARLAAGYVRKPTAPVGDGNG